MAVWDDTFPTVLLGGALIGLAAGLLILLTGREMSASGMIGSLLGGAEGVAATSIAFIGGIAVAPLIMTSLGFSLEAVREADWPFLVSGGLLVGFAARFGGASIGGAMIGLATRPRQAVIILITVFAGAAISVYLQRVLGGGGGA